MLIIFGPVSVITQIIRPSGRLQCERSRIKRMIFNIYTYFILRNRFISTHIHHHSAKENKTPYAYICVYVIQTTSAQKLNQSKSSLGALPPPEIPPKI